MEPTKSLDYREQYARAWTLPKPSKASALESLESLAKLIPEEDYRAENQYRSLLRYFQPSPSKTCPKTLPEWASLFRGKDQARPGISEMHITDGRLEATDGKICIQVPGYAGQEDGYYSHDLTRIDKPETYPNFAPILHGGDTLPAIKFHGLESLKVGTLEASRSGVEETSLVFQVGEKWIQKKFLDKVLAGRKLTTLGFRGNESPLGPLFFFGWASRADKTAGGSIRGAVMPIRYEQAT